MTDPARDNYSVYYADKLWQLLPAVYRTLDTDQLGANGPLREMVNRIGATTAVLRQSIDRLWENQSIETCDDWVIPYIAQLVGTRLVQGLDSSGQRLDVANTITYRRRKGTVGLIEQLAHDISGWDAKVVEFFRRLGRTRHGLDPPVGPIGTPGSQLTALHEAEGLVGPLTFTHIGGFADLRNVYGATKSRSAFDEYYHFADTRQGDGDFGWHAIPHLGVFVWRLLSLEVKNVTPVAVKGCPGWFTFDPTGRDTPLFAAQRDAAAFGDIWVSPSEGQLPTPISQALLNADVAAGQKGLGLYPVVPPPENVTMPDAVMSVAPASTTDDPYGASGQNPAVVLRPERGRFKLTASPTPTPLATYHYGFPSEIGAGPYDRRTQTLTIATPTPRDTLKGGGTALASIADPHHGTVTLGDSLTYAGAPDLDVDRNLTVNATNNQRPLIRLDAGKPWTIHGHSDETSLTLDGLFVSGQDIVLTGAFSTVTISCCTLDPGSGATPDVFDDPFGSPPGSPFQIAADGRPLRPTRLWIEAAVTSLVIDRCVLGPIRTRGAGNVETTTIGNSTLQAIRTSNLGPITQADVMDPDRLERELQLGLDPVSMLLRSLAPSIGATLGHVASPPPATPSPPSSDLATLIGELNGLIAAPSLYRPGPFKDVALSAETSRLKLETAGYGPATALNRLLLEDAYPMELADAALAFADGALALSRCTVMGRIVAHRFSASECILRELATVDDIQDGCTRFTAWAQGSQLPRQYECVSIRQGAPLFTTTDFGQPGYAQLLPNVDAQRLPPTTKLTTPQNTISAGAADASEMGAYARDKNPIRAQALMVKLQEYMPANLVPVIVDVT
jgi:hypothetical protein